MPKTKLSQKYLKNLKIFRGPTHNITNIPQFAPMKFIQHPLTDLDIQKYKQHSNQQGQILYQNPKYPEVNEFGGKKIINQYQNKQKSLQTDGQSFPPQIPTKMASIYTNRQARAFLSFQRKIRRRYQTIRAPYKKKDLQGPGFKMFYSQKQAKKQPYYQDLIYDQNRKQDDDQIVQDPLKRKGFDK